MKKFNFKLRLQWGWYKAAIIGIMLALLITPVSGGMLGIGNQKETSVISTLQNISFGDKVMVMLNGEVVALAKSEEDGEKAFKEARLRYNEKGVRILNVDVDYKEVNPKKDRKKIKGLHVLKGEKLSDAILKSFSQYDEKKSLAYTMRIDDYTVTAKSMEDLILALEQAQGKYDETDDFQVELKTPVSQNVAMYEVGVSKKETKKEDLKEDSSQETVSTQENLEENKKEKGKKKKKKKEELPKELTAEDGVKFIGFSDKIQVMETYVAKEQTKEVDAIYGELTAENQEESIYVVEPGDCLSVIAEKNKLSVDQIKELNPHIESDNDIYFDDRLNITVPRAAVQILVEKQETYKEDYHEDIVYEDDAEMYIGETEVVREGTAGTHVVTDLVTYKDNIESDRKQLNEIVEVAAVPQVVRRGTKSKPTYMLPVTNWNITSYFGYRWGRLHAGVDVGVPIGTTVRASRGGRIVTAGWLGGYGNCVIIDHGDGVSTRYGHLSQVTVGIGQYVDQGQQVALSGNTGRSTGPHLHFEIRINGQAVDPLPYLSY